MAEMRHSDLGDCYLAGSEVFFEFHCEPCETEGIHVEADCYCQTCSEYLCSDCNRHHRKSSASRHHKLLDKLAMPKVKLPKTAQDIIAEPCPKHNDRILEYFCRDNSKLCCNVCLNTEHRACKDTSYIPEISAGISSGQEFTELTKEIERLILMVNTKYSTTQTYEKDNDLYESRALTNIKNLRKELDDVLDELEEGAVKNVSEQKHHNAEQLQQSSAKYQKVLSDLQQMSSELRAKSKTGENNQLFVKVKLFQNRMSEIVDEIRVIDVYKLTHYTFNKEQEKREVISSLRDLWLLSIRQNGHVQNVKLFEKIPVKTDSETENCLIGNIAVLGNARIVVTDEYNRSIKLISTEMKKVVSYIKVPSVPHGIAQTSENSIAVTLPRKNKIQLLDISMDTLSKKSTIRLENERPLGICSYDDNFIITCPPSYVKILDGTGNVLRTFDMDSMAEYLFGLPLCLTLSRDHSNIHVTDVEADIVITLTIDGEIEKVYKDESFIFPYGITVGQYGELLVNSVEENSSVLQVINQGERRQVVYDTTQMDNLPFALAYCDENNTIYCSFIKHDGDSIDVISDNESDGSSNDERYCKSDDGSDGNSDDESDGRLNDERYCKSDDGSDGNSDDESDGRSDNGSDGERNDSNDSKQDDRANKRSTNYSKQYVNSELTPADFIYVYQLE